MNSVLSWPRRTEISTDQKISRLQENRASRSQREDPVVRIGPDSRLERGKRGDRHPYQSIEAKTAAGNYAVEECRKYQMTDG